MHAISLERFRLMLLEYLLKLTMLNQSLKYIKESKTGKRSTQRIDKRQKC